MVQVISGFDKQAFFGSINTLITQRMSIVAKLTPALMAFVAGAHRPSAAFHLKEYWL
jgi:hypothetical protein